MDLPKPDIQIAYDFDNNQMTLSTSNYASYVYLHLDEDTTLKLSNNFFDLTPGWPVTVKVLSVHKLYQI